MSFFLLKGLREPCKKRRTFLKHKRHNLVEITSYPTSNIRKLRRMLNGSEKSYKSPTIKNITITVKGKYCNICVYVNAV